MSDVRFHGERRVAEAVVATVRLLRRSGLPLGPGESLTALRAVSLVGIDSRVDVEHALAAALVKRLEHMPLFQLVFDACWKMVAPVLPSDDPQQAPGLPHSPRPGLQRLLEAMTEGASRRSASDDAAEASAAGSTSDRERLRSKDIAQMSAHEARRAKSLLAESWSLGAEIRSRRFTPSKRGDGIDVRRSLAKASQSGGELMELPRRERSRRPPHIVTLIDISGSMSEYTRVYLHFAYLLSQRFRGAETFVFGTRLSRVTRALSGRDPDVAMERCVAAAEDWDGGTRISQALKSFNKTWSRRVLSRPSVVLLFTDGLERDEAGELSHQAAALSRRARGVVWLNPLLRFGGFSPRAGGIQSLLPHVTEMVAGHSVKSLTDVVRRMTEKRHYSVRSFGHTRAYDWRSQLDREGSNVGKNQR